MRSGKIEFNRFVFSILVLLFHFDVYYAGLEKFSDKTFEFTRCAHGAIGVEFFFLVSGFLMAKKVYKNMNTYGKLDGQGLSNETASFMWGKFKSIFPYHVVAFVMLFTTKVIIEKTVLKNMLIMLVDSVPNFFLVQMSGIGKSGINHIEWYISVMLIVMFIIYPLIRKYYYVFVKIIAPIAALLIIGYMDYTYGGLTGVKVWTGIGYKSMYRGIADICLGCVAFEICRVLNESKNFTTVKKIMLTILEFVSYGLTFVFSFTNFTRNYEIYALALLFVAVILSFSNVTCGKCLFQNKICFALGKASLPIYLSQLTVITIVSKKYASLSFKCMVLKSVPITIVCTAICYFGGVLLSKMVTLGRKNVMNNKIKNE